MRISKQTKKYKADFLIFSDRKIIKFALPGNQNEENAEIPCFPSSFFLCFLLMLQFVFLYLNQDLLWMSDINSFVAYVDPGCIFFEGGRIMPFVLLLFIFGLFSGYRRFLQLCTAGLLLLYAFHIYILIDFLSSDPNTFLVFMIRPLFASLLVIGFIFFSCFLLILFQLKIILLCRMPKPKVSVSSANVFSHEYISIQNLFVLFFIGIQVFCLYQHARALLRTDIQQFPSTSDFLSFSIALRNWPLLLSFSLLFAGMFGKFKTFLLCSAAGLMIAYLFTIIRYLTFLTIPSHYYHRIIPADPNPAYSCYVSVEFLWFFSLFLLIFGTRIIFELFRQLKLQFTGNITK